MNESKTLKLVVRGSMLVLVAFLTLRYAAKHNTEQRSAEPTPALAPVASGLQQPRVAPVEQAVAIPAPAEEDEGSETNVMELSREKVAEYLQRHNRDATSLLAAYHALKDTNLLNEAAEKFPNEPYVQWAMLTSESLDPAGRRKWLDAFKASSPDNSLADYLSAAEHFKSGDRDLALKEIVAASGKAQFKDFTMETMIDEQELRRASGQSAMLAMHGTGWAGDLLQEMSPMKAVANGIADAQDQFKKSGDAASADNLVTMGLALAGRLNSGEGNKFVMGEMVGDAIEEKMLKTLDPNTKFESLGGKTPSERLDEMKQSKAAFRELMNVLPKAYGVLNESEWVTYSDRVKTFGEHAALQWLQQRVESAEAK